MRKKWMLKRIGADYEGLGKIFGLDPLVIRILVNRGYDTEEKIRLFLSADETIFDCADGLPDIGSAVSALERFRKEGKKIRIIGDYDIDGVCATAILLKALKAYGMEMLDAPVSGGEPMAVAGTLSVMVGGKKELFEKYKELIGTMASSVVYVGEIGSGNVAKLANQMIVAVNIAVVAEALTFAKKAGTDPRLVFEAIKGGLAGSNVMNAKAPMMLEGNYKPGFRINLHTKDLTNALNAAHAVYSPVPFTAQAMEIMQFLNAEGCGSDDHDAMVKYYEKISGTGIAEK